MFEKSNVLVMYVMLWILLITPLSLFQRSNRFRSVFSFYTRFLVLISVCTGKTLLARTLAKVLDVPFSVSDATSFTQVGNSIFQQT